MQAQTYDFPGGRRTMMPMQSMPPGPPVRLPRVLAALSLPVMLLAPLCAHAADPIPDGARLAATCTGCHGTNGATAGDALPRLAGRSREALLASLKAFRSGEREATVMMQLAKGYTDAQLEEIATFFAAQQATGVAKPAGAGS